MADLYGDDSRFRSRVVMARHGFGSGEYKYFSYPLPPLVEGLRTALYPHLAPIANAWNERMGLDDALSGKARDFLALCHVTVRSRPTPLLLRYEAGRLQLPAPGPVWRARLPAADGDPAVGTGQRLHGRRVRTDRTTAAHAEPGRGGAAQAGRRGRIRGASPAGQRDARHVSRHHAPRREPAAFRPPLDAGRHLPRREIAIFFFGQTGQNVPCPRRSSSRAGPLSIAGWGSSRPVSIIGRRRRSFRSWCGAASRCVS